MATLQHEQHVPARPLDTHIQTLGAPSTDYESASRNPYALLCAPAYQMESVKVFTSCGTGTQEPIVSFAPLTEAVSMHSRSWVWDITRGIREERLWHFFVDVPEEEVEHPPTEDQPIWEAVAQIGASAPPEAWADVPRDASKNFKQALYGEPEGSE